MSSRSENYFNPGKSGSEVCFIPEPFKEPEGMITIDLKKTSEEPKDFTTIKKKSSRKLQLFLIICSVIGLMVLCLLSATYLIYYEGHPNRLPTASGKLLMTDNSGEKILTHPLIITTQIDRCKFSRSTRDCCNIFQETSVGRKCNVDRILALLSSTDRFKRASDYYGIEPDNSYQEEEVLNYEELNYITVPSAVGAAYDPVTGDDDPEGRQVLGDDFKGSDINPLINATTTIANITDLKASPGELKIEFSDTKAQARISQANDFDKSSDNGPKIVMNPCFGPQPNFNPYPSQQPMYMINPPMYPYIPMQYHNNFPGYQGYQNYYSSPRSVVQTGPGGQFYICNPLAQTTNIAGIPGVEVRRNSESLNLQQLVESTGPMNTTRARESSPLECAEGEQGCLDGSKCIHFRQICDNEVDCTDGSDEMDCPCSRRVGLTRLCDGYLDCPNGEDELNCFECSEDEFSCDDWSRFHPGTCIPMEQRCDGIKHCDLTGRDEEDCSVLTDHVGHQALHKISNAVGFLHRNFRGRWWPTCHGAERWAVEICNTESGPSDTLPKLDMVAYADKYEGSFVSSTPTGRVRLTPMCHQKRAAFVECPPLFCGLRMTFLNPFRASELDTSSEDHMFKHRDSVLGASGNDSVLGISRVVGGKASQPAAWPWVVSIYKNGVFHCGGVLINDLWVVTAAHCVSKFWFFYYELQAGMLRRFSYSPMEQNRWALQAFPHEAYDKKSLKNDIALIKISSPIRFNRYVRPICLPSDSTAGRDYLKGPKANSVCTTVGWGATVEHGIDPDHLREVEVPILDRCKHAEDQQGDEICAGLTEGGRDACQGDSGGPLMCRNENNPGQWYLAGIVSHGEGCARPNEPGVYTKVSRYNGWIADKIKSGQVVRTVPLRRCPGYICKGTKRCLSKKRRCDKTVDCLFGDDEFNCGQGDQHGVFMRHPQLVGAPPLEVTEPMLAKSAKGAKPRQKSFGCRKMLQFLPLDKRCDKVVDCEDGSDEDQCLCADYLRRRHPEAVCDGIVDCKDVSDEIDCGNCRQTQFFCRISHQCVPLSGRCDGKADCTRGEDEWDCAALTDGNTLVLDNDLRPSHNAKGIITINRSGVWRPFCSPMATDSMASIATNVCNLLGLSDYTLFHKLSVPDKPLEVNVIVRTPATSSFAKGSSCSGLFVGCSDVSIEGDPTAAVPVNRDNITRQAELYSLAWNAVIYFDGKFRCMGTILNADWIVAAVACFPRPLEQNFVSVLLGKGKAHLDVEGPHEQTIRITHFLHVNGSDSIFLQTEHKIQFSRYIKPTIPTASKSLPSKSEEKCVAIYHDDGDWQKNETHRTEVVMFKSSKPQANNRKCAPGYRCFKLMNSFNYNCNRGSEESWSGVITCDSRNGWYPAAIFSNIKSPCNASPPLVNWELQSIENYDPSKIQEVVLKKSFSFQTKYKEFRCKLGGCLDESKICDGTSDCRGGEDEDEDFCAEKRRLCHLSSACGNFTGHCRPFEIRCKNGNCIPKNQFCDRKNDCGDHSDEPNICSCGAYLELSHPKLVCDGKVNCHDRTDEDLDTCKCDTGSRIPCEGSKFCISRSMLCDGFVDCPKGEDEMNCMALKASGSSYNRGEVVLQTAGIWHNACFKPEGNFTTSFLEDICERLGFSGGSARQLRTNSTGDVMTVPVMEPFHLVRIRKGDPVTGNRGGLKLRIRSGSRPYVTWKRDLHCRPLFVECL